MLIRKNAKTLCFLRNPVIPEFPQISHPSGHSVSSLLLSPESASHPVLLCVTTWFQSTLFQFTFCSVVCHYGVTPGGGDTETAEGPCDGACDAHKGTPLGPKEG